MSAELPIGPRAADEDREETARLLREHFAAGRLGEDEMSDRVQAAYEARTTDQLAALTADLPKLPVTAQQRKAELVARRGELQRQLIQQTGAGLIPFAICTVIWIAAGATGPFWPIWVVLVALIPFLRGGWSLYGPAPDLDAVEAELARRRQRDRRSGRRDSRRASRRSR
ncbi:MAG: DUF1707 domain-containing protein [Solirubrobacteraceae bacterium]